MIGGGAGSFGQAGIPGGAGGNGAGGGWFSGPRPSTMLLGPGMNSVSLAKSSMTCWKMVGPGLRGGSRPRFLCNGGGPFPFAVVVSSLFVIGSAEAAGWTGIGEGGGRTGGTGVDAGVVLRMIVGKSEPTGIGTKDVKGTGDGALPGAGGAAGARRDGTKSRVAIAAFDTAVIDDAEPVFGAAFTGRPRFLGAAFAGRAGMSAVSPAATKTTGRCNTELELPVGPGAGRTTGPYFSRFLVSLRKCRSLWMCWTKPVWSSGVLLIGSLQTWQ